MVRLRHCRASHPNCAVDTRASSKPAPKKKVLIADGSDDSDDDVAHSVAAPTARKRRIVESDSEDDQRAWVQSSVIVPETPQAKRRSFIIPETPPSDLARDPAPTPAPACYYVAQNHY